VDTYELSHIQVDVADKKKSRPSCPEFNCRSGDL